ncbi:UPF0687 protein C20orf27 homolog [Toxorhynchites rutilus septentrionalis]|uniref:UPF0687 protein C20orf27 homolog n=1 Tax=Toxorhynchites rutilus septentrionalis TaxID=329112 RepID=UPI0024795AC7|nr:UPF0687 protein C20orf27 homolog [Toxorhynchites rutilus septentrionalis]XP_055640671.1 UPF0687 protein C20orf27 homolog [Toxorhynchites rutilus septentrionalis]
MEEAHHHVHFDATVINDELHDNTIIYEVANAGSLITVQLGFLQINHKYRLELNIPAYALVQSGFNVGKNTSFEVEDSQLLNLNCKLIEFTTQPIKTVDGKDHYSATVEFFTHKEKLLKEHLTICGKEDSSIKLQIVFVARVLGKGKGTPMLRDGIHLIHVEDDDESELSDWQGFPKTE